MANAILLISCPDQRGITAAVTGFIFQNNGNIIHADQHIDEQTNTFFMRVEWSLEGFKFPTDQLTQAFDPLARKFRMQVELSLTDQIPRIAIFVSRHVHCLHDLLFRHKSGQLRCAIPLIISNHDEGGAVAGQFGVAFHHFHVTQDNKPQIEQQQLALLKKERVDLVVLAQYHQILTAQFIKEYPHRIVNIHHSFLPAFVGSNPYQQAYERGVKIIGATSHYVIEALDQGPIIEQDTVRVSHRDSLSDMVVKGQDLERVVLSRAVRLALEHKILCYNNKTVIFD
jgi:formyltetrahydrofolate deformylase